jgi:ribonuclease HI
LEDRLKGNTEVTLISEGIGPAPTASITVNFDGLCEPVNPGGVGVGAFVIKENGLIVKRQAVLAGIPGDPDTSNNLAEYSGIISALEYLASIGFHGNALIQGDSALVVNQLTGAYEVRSTKLVPLHAHAASLMRNLANDGGKVVLTWVPREENEDADTTTREGFLTFLKNSVEPWIITSPGESIAKTRNARNIGCNEIERRDEYMFSVPSFSSSEIYTVDISSFTCSCASYQKRKRPCKHLVLVVNCLLSRMVE